MSLNLNTPITPSACAGGSTSSVDQLSIPYPGDPHQLDTTHGTISFFFDHRTETIHGSINRPRMVSKHVMRFNKCMACSSRAAQYCSLSGPDGPILECIKGHQNTDLDGIAKCSHDICSGPVTGIHFLGSHATLYNHAPEQGDRPDGMKWNHLTIPVIGSTCSQEYLDLLQYVFKRYLWVDTMLGTSLFQRFVDNLILQGMTSIDLMKICLDKVSYGQLFIPALEWSRSILLDLTSSNWRAFSPKDRIVFGLKHLIKAGLTKDSHSTVVPLFQTAYDNLIGLLCTAKSESAMMSLVADRLDPVKYKRPTAPPTVGQTQNAIRELGDFVNAAMTTVVAQELIPEMVSITRAGPNTTSMSGFAAQIANATKKAGGGSFADRVGKSASDLQIASITTVHRLIEFIRMHPDSTLEIALSSGNMAMLATTTLDKIRFRHPWKYFTGSSSSNLFHVGVNGPWATVTHIVPMYEYIRCEYQNCLFVVNGVRPNQDFFGNCCIRMFLQTEYQRTCGPAFEALNQITKMEVSTTSPLMVGIGITAPAGKNDLIGALLVRLNGKELSLSQL
jgi:hypothetical protein